MARRTVLLASAILLITVVAPPAVGQARRAASLTPAEADVHAVRGLKHYKSGRFKEAAEALGRAAALKPDDPSVHYNLGMAYVQLGRYLHSIKPFREALRLNPKYAAAYPKLGAVYNYFGQYDAAADLLSRALRLGPGDADVYNNLGIAYYHMGRYEEAAGALNRAVTLSPDFAVPYLNLSNVYQKMGRHKEAGEARARADRISSAEGERSDIRLPGGGASFTAAQRQVGDARPVSSSILIIRDDVSDEGHGAGADGGEASHSPIPRKNKVEEVRQPGEKAVPTAAPPPVTVQSNVSGATANEPDEVRPHPTN
ncbi:MAG: tetratricopeptide repeat protein, partial [Pyrinomonadaceae bacterium]